LFKTRLSHGERRREMKITELIKVEKTESGYQLIDAKGNYPQEGLTHQSRQSAYRDAALLWPYNSTWEGHKVKGGYRITIS